MSINKYSMTIQEHIDLYKDRALLISDIDEVTYRLTHVGYYRLSIYAKVFQNKDNDFLNGVTFDNITNLYRFDRKLRLLTLELLEKIESSLKSNIINYLASYGGALVLYKGKSTNTLFIDDEIFELSNNIITKNNNHKAIKHYLNQRVLIPVWVLLQVATLGDLNRIFRKLLPAHRIAISEIYSLNFYVFKNFFEGFRTIRNICAHHDRLRNNIFRELVLKENPIRAYIIDQRSLGSYFLVFIYFCCQIEINITSLEDWVNRLEILCKHHKINLEMMGMEGEWFINARKLINSD